MIGNDVVDLLDLDADHSTFRPRFDARVFAPEERARIEASDDPIRERWRFWAAKEASYKLARKQDATSVFSPSRFVVELSETSLPLCAAPDSLRMRSGRVRGPVGEHQVCMEEGSRFVHAIATIPADVAPRIACVEELAAAAAGARRPEAASLAVRELARRELARQLGLPESELEIVSRDRVPYLCCAGRPLAVDLSLSHHGAFVAFACSFEPRVRIPRDLPALAALGAAS